MIWTAIVINVLAVNGAWLNVYQPRFIIILIAHICHFLSKCNNWYHELVNVWTKSPAKKKLSVPGWSSSRLNKANRQIIINNSKYNYNCYTMSRWDTWVKGLSNLKQSYRKYGTFATSIRPTVYAIQARVSCLFHSIVIANLF